MGVGGTVGAEADAVAAGETGAVVEFIPCMLQRSSRAVLNDCDSPRRLHSRPMASLAPLSPRHPAGLIPSGELWLPVSYTHLTLPTKRIV